MSRASPLGMLALVLLLMAAAHPQNHWKPRCIILVAVDTCRADHLHCYGYQRHTSPNTDALAAEGVRFDNVFSQSNESLFSYSSLFTDRYARQIGPLSHSRFQVPKSAATLASELRAYGYNTAAFVAGGHLSRQFGFSSGFNTYQDRWDFGSLFDTMPAALDWLSTAVKQPSPVFLLVHGYDAHDPYYKPLGFSNMYDPDYEGVASDIVCSTGAVERIYRNRYYAEIPRRLQVEAERTTPDMFDPMYLLPVLDRTACPAVPLTDSDIQHLIAAYDGAITYADVWIGLLRARLHELGIAQQTLLAVFGDHGEELGDQEYFSHRVNLHDSSLHVPLVLWAPGSGIAHQAVSEVCELRALASTVRDFAGLPASSGAPSLRGLLGGGVASPAVAVSEGIYPEASIRTAHFRLTYQGDARYDPDVLSHMASCPLDARHFHLYDVKADPKDTTDLMDRPQLHAVAADLRRQLCARLR